MYLYIKCTHNSVYICINTYIKYMQEVVPDTGSSSSVGAEPGAPVAPTGAPTTLEYLLFPASPALNLGYQLPRIKLCLVMAVTIQYPGNPGII